MNRKTFYILLSGLSIIGIIIVNYSTFWGVGLLDWDSFNYISSARNLAIGNGYVIPLRNERFAPLTHYPPMFPTVLAIFEILGTDAIIAARLLNMALVGGSIGLIGITLREITKSYYFGLFASLLFVSSNVLIEIHSWALSEPLLILLTLLGFLTYYKYSQQGKFITLIVTSILLSFAFLTKFAAAANVGVVLLLLFWQKRNAYKRKIKELAVVASISIFPMVLWTARNYSLTENINAREFGYHPLTMGNFEKAFHTFFSWFFPDFLLLDSKKLLLYCLLAIIFTIIVISIIYIWKNYRPEILRQFRSLQINSLTLIFASYWVMSIFTVLMAKTFLDPAIGMSDRIFAPILLSSLVLISAFLSSLWSLKIRWLNAMVISAVAYLIIFSAIGSYNKIADLHENGLGLNRKEIRISMAMQLLEELADDKKIYNNHSLALYLRTGQVGYEFSSLTDQLIPTEGIIVAIFKSKSPQQHPIVERYSENLELLADDEVASVYLYKP